MQNIPAAQKFLNWI